MTKLSRCSSRLAAMLLMLAVAGPAAAAELMVQLREGGYVLYFRHAQTDWSQSDRPRGAEDFGSCDGGRMRQLSAQGRHTARTVGESMRALGIPVGEVVSSEYCRCVETARALGLGPVTTTRDVINARVAEQVGGPDALRERARKRLGARPRAGTNTVVVAHGNIALLVGLERPPEGGALVLRPLGGGDFDLVGRIDPGQWETSAGTD